MKVTATIVAFNWDEKVLWFTIISMVLSLPLFLVLLVYRTGNVHLFTKDGLIRDFLYSFLCASFAQLIILAGGEYSPIVDGWSHRLSNKVVIAASLCLLMPAILGRIIFLRNNS
jgi:hypothetical protein